MFQPKNLAFHAAKSATRALERRVPLRVALPFSLIKSLWDLTRVGNIISLKFAKGEF